MKTQKTILANPCGCEVVERQQIAGLSPTYYTIEYCSKHAAAKAMYDALCCTALGLGIAEMEGYKRFKALKGLVNKALNKAEGK